uniref:Uncharacterized protein n=1 Tax=Aegilops tauschii subsp. strangulata TaxID=200361 RepID=A0A453MWH9_AEGTS
RSDMSIQIFFFFFETSKIDLFEVGIIGVHLRYSPDFVHLGRSPFYTHGK